MVKYAKLHLTCFLWARTSEDYAFWREFSQENQGTEKELKRATWARSRLFIMKKTSDFCFTNLWSGNSESLKCSWGNQRRLKRRRIMTQLKGCDKTNQSTVWIILLERDILLLSVSFKSYLLLNYFFYRSTLFNFILL